MKLLTTRPPSKLIAFIFALLAGARQGQAFDDVLMLGDSMSMGSRAFGAKLIQQLPEDLKISVFASSGGNPSYWNRQSNIFADQLWITGGERQFFTAPNNPRAVPSLESLLEARRPKTVIIQAGLNMLVAITTKGLYDQKKATLIKEEIELLLAPISRFGASCIWIGAPKVTWKSDALQQQLVDLLSETLKGRCHFLDARLHTKEIPNTDDGIHFSPEGYAQWVENAQEDLMSLLAAPVKSKPLVAKPIVETPVMPPPPPKLVAQPVVVDDDLVLEASVLLEQATRIPNLRDLAYHQGFLAYQYKLLSDLRLHEGSTLKAGTLIRVYHPWALVSENEPGVRTLKLDVPIMRLVRNAETKKLEQTTTLKIAEFPHWCARDENKHLLSLQRIDDLDFNAEELEFIFLMR